MDPSGGSEPVLPAAADHTIYAEEGQKLMRVERKKWAQMLLLCVAAVDVVLVLLPSAKIISCSLLCVLKNVLWHCAG